MLVVRNARGAGVVRRPVVPMPVVQMWYDRPWCGLPVVPRVIACRVWFHRTPVVPHDPVLV